MIDHMLPNSSPDSFSIDNSFIDLSDTEMAATSGGLTPLDPKTLIGAANKIVRWEGKLSQDNRNLPLLAQRLITGYHKGTNRPEDVAFYKSLVGFRRIYWEKYRAQIFDLLPFTAGGTPAAISSVGAFLSLF